MYAIIKTGGKQCRVEPGCVVDVELLGKEDGSQVEFKEVLFFSEGDNHEIGSPHVNSYVVKGELLETVFGPKVTTLKYKRRKNNYRKFGHRQRYSRVKITEIAKGE